MKLQHLVMEHAPFSGGAFTVLLILALRANPETRQCDPGLKRLARDARLQVRQVRNILRQLEAGGWIRTLPGGGRRTEGGRTNSYCVTPVVPSAAPCEENVGDRQWSASPERHPSAGLDRQPEAEAPALECLRKTHPSKEPRKGEAAPRHSSQDDDGEALVAAVRDELAAVEAPMHPSAVSDWVRHVTASLQPRDLDQAIRFVRAAVRQLIRSGIPKAQLYPRMLASHFARAWRDDEEFDDVFQGRRRGAQNANR